MSKKKDTKQVITEEQPTVEKNTNQKVVEEQEQKTVQEEEALGEGKLKKELATEKDKFLRLFAEFENYKKRTSRERIELFKTAGQDIMVSMLPVLDDFDRALSEISKGKDKELIKGVELISNKFKNTLNGKGLSLIEVKAGDVFDAELHEAITQISAPSDDLKGKIIDVVEKGYKLGEKIIRHPKVVVGQ